MGIYLPEKVYGCGRMAASLLCCSPHNNDIKKPPASGCSVARDINADPSAPNHKNYSKEYSRKKNGASTNLSLSRDTLLTEGIHIFEM